MLFAFPVKLLEIVDLFEDVAIALRSACLNERTISETRHPTIDASSSNAAVTAHNGIRIQMETRQKQGQTLRHRIPQLHVSEHEIDNVRNLRRRDAVQRLLHVAVGNRSRQIHEKYRQNCFRVNIEELGTWVAQLPLRWRFLYNFSL